MLHTSKYCARFMSTGVLRRTALFELHKQLGGKMVPFEGWEMPVQYSDGIKNSVLHCRSNASVFDVSHMAQVRISGPDHVRFLESIVPSDVEALHVNSGTLSIFTNESGGVLDDLVLTKTDDGIYMVVNAGRREHDIPYMQEKAGSSGLDVNVDEISGKSLLAVQGPKSEKVLAHILPASTVEVVKNMNFMTGRGELDGGADFGELRITRCGYTGEDGFEVSVDDANVEALMQTLVGQSECLPAGLGARDVLRMEAGLCLYGHELSGTITPVEAKLMWTIAKRRRMEGGFPGYAEIMEQFAAKGGPRRIGLVMDKGCPPARDGSPVFANGQEIGKITSGTYSPHLETGIAQAYIQSPFWKKSADISTVEVEVRGRRFGATVAAMPFVKTGYKTAA